MLGRQYRGVRCKKLDMAIAASIEPTSLYVDTHSCLSRTNLSTVRMYVISFARQHKSKNKANPASAAIAELGYSPNAAREASRVPE
jgi:hypothetical protein